MSRLPQWDQLTWDARRRHAQVLEAHIAALTARRDKAKAEAKAAITRRNELASEVETLRELVTGLREHVMRLGDAIPPDFEGPDRLAEAITDMTRKAAS